MKKTKAILSSVLALALTAGLSASGWAENSTLPVESASAVSTEPIESIDSKIVTKDYNSLEETLTPMELAAIMGEEPIDPAGRTYPIGHEVEIPDYVASTNATSYTLTKSDITNAYDYWVGRFIVSDLSNFSVRFTEPETFYCSYNANDKKKSATIEAKYGYTGNYKRVRIKYTYMWYDSNGKAQYDIFVATSEGTDKTLTASKGYTGQGKLVDVMCFYSLRSGTESTATMREYVVVDIMDRSYSTSAEFAAMPHAGLLDQYKVILDDTTE